MQLNVSLDHSDFMTALEEYIRRNMTVPEGKDVTMDITAGRGDKGYSAIVTFTDPQDNTEIGENLRKQGNSTARLGSDVLPKAIEAKAVEDVVEVPTIQEEPLQPEVTQQEEKKSEEATPVVDAPKPLFSFDKS